MEQKIKCNVENCKHCDCEEKVCKLKEIKVCNCGCDEACECDETMCGSFKERKK